MYINNPICAFSIFICVNAIKDQVKFKGIRLNCVSKYHVNMLIKDGFLKSNIIKNEACDMIWKLVLKSDKCFSLILWKSFELIFTRWQILKPTSLGLERMNIPTQ